MRFDYITLSQGVKFWFERMMKIRDIQLSILLNILALIPRKYYSQKRRNKFADTKR